MKRLPVLAVISLLLTSCALHEYTTDISKDPRGQAAVGHCFALRRDAFILKAPRHITIEKPSAGELNVFGVISFWSGAETDPRQVLKLPAGTRVTVERVLSRYSPSVGDSVTTYGRMNGKFDDLYIDSTELFEFTFSKDPVVPVRAYVERCD
jgi:hypothetical protein